MTAVQWLKSELTEVERNLINKTFLQLNNTLAGHRLKDIFEQAKEMEMEKQDDFAIEFAEWCDDNYFRMGNTSFWAESMDWDNDDKFTTKELLEIYKKEKGL